MKSQSKVILLVIMLWTLGSVHVFAEEGRNRYAVDEGLLVEIREKIEHHSGEGGDETALKLWQYLLEGLLGDYSVKKALKQATICANNNCDDAADLWGRAVQALEVVRHLKIWEYDYNFDPELIVVIQNMINKYTLKGKNGKARTWMNVLMAMMGDGDLKKATKKIKSLRKKERPPEWSQIIDGLEGYERKRETHAVAKNAYSYDIYDTETGEKIHTLEIDSDTKKGSVGDYDSKNGKTEWEIQFAGGEKDADYLSYGWWAHSKANGDKNKTYQRDRAVFFHGDSPAEQIDQVRGIAVYTGDAVGTWQRNTTKDGDINGFTGDVELVANFEEGSVAGYVKNIDDPDLPVDKIALGKAYYDSNAQMSGETRAFENGSAVGYSGDWEGGFFNQENPEDAPGEIGGVFDVTTGKGSQDIDIKGAFGSSLVNHDDSYRQN